MSRSLPPFTSNRAVFGCVAYVHLHKNQRSKLDPCAIRCVFIGFSPQQKGYRCYHPPSKHVYVTMDVTFSEEEHFFPRHNLQGEMTGVEDYAWVDVSTPTVLDNPQMHDNPQSSNGRDNHDVLDSTNSFQSPNGCDDYLRAADCSGPHDDDNDSSPNGYGSTMPCTELCTETASGPMWQKEPSPRDLVQSLQQPPQPQFSTSP